MAVAERVSLRQLVGGVLVGFVVLGGAVVWGFVQQERTNADLHQVIHLDEIEDEVDDATRCVAAFESREQTRDGLEEAVRASSSALIQLAQESGETPAEVIARFEEITDERVRAARAEIADPDYCDRDKAEEILRSPEAREQAVTEDGQ